MNRYSYKGPIKEFDTVLNGCWQSETVAPTEAKAKSNLMYQAKKMYGRPPGARISLPGKIKLIG